MLSHFLTQRLDHLRQPALLRHIPPNMIDVDGVVLPSALRGLDDLFCEEAVRRVLEWQMPDDLPFGVRREDRWRMVSSLQKAIRRGDIEKAMIAAHATYDMDAAYLVRRLVVIAIEDVMLGNLYGVALTLALAGDHKARKIGGERKTLVWLAALLASGWKDRSACNLCTVVSYDPDLASQRRTWARRPDDELGAMATDLSEPIEHRMLAAWILAGTKRFHGLNMPEDNDRARWPLMRLMAQSGMPLVLYWIADRAAQRGGGCMFVSLLPIWQTMRDQDEVSLAVGQHETDPGLGPLMSAALDMHTREGKAAISKLGAITAIREALQPARSDEARMDALYGAVFAVEGGALDLRVDAAGLNGLHLGATKVELRSYGLRTLSGQAALLTAVLAKLPTLHAERFRRLQALPVTLGYKANRRDQCSANPHILGLGSQSNTQGREPLKPLETAPSQPLGHDAEPL